VHVSPDGAECDASAAGSAAAGALALAVRAGPAHDDLDHDLAPERHRPSAQRRSRTTHLLADESHT